MGTHADVIDSTNPSAKWARHRPYYTVYIFRYELAFERALSAPQKMGLVLTGIRHLLKRVSERDVTGSPHLQDVTVSVQHGKVGTTDTFCRTMRLADSVIQRRRRRYAQAPCLWFASKGLDPIESI